MLTHEYVNELFDYREGKLYWKVSRGRVKIGDEAGTNQKGYLVTTIDAQRYSNHQIVYLMHNGYIPDCIDHIDGNPANNSLDNLRAATLSENQFNRKMQRNNTSGVKGVFWNSRYKKWQVTINVNNRQHFAGRYTNIEDAKLAATNKRNQLHKEFSNHG